MIMTNNARISMAFVIALVVIANLSCRAQGPFGFVRGMTREKVIELVGQSAVEDSGAIKGIPIAESGGKGVLVPFAPEDEDSITYLVIRTAPRPYAAFESYLLRFYSGYGLMKVVAVTPKMEAGISENDIKAKFEAISTELSGTRSRPDLRVASEMTTSNFFERVWNLADWKSKFAKGERVMDRTWEWECEPNQKFIKEVYRKYKRSPSPGTTFPCGSPSANGFPPQFFRGSRVAKMELRAEILSEHTGRVSLMFDFDGEEDLELAIGLRAEEFNRQ